MLKGDILIALTRKRAGSGRSVGPPLTFLSLTKEIASARINGAGGAVVSLEFSSGEDRYQREPAHDETPERLFERRLALFGARTSRGEIRTEFVVSAAEHFDQLKRFSSRRSERRMPS